jgi:hypothetical protein
MRDSSSPLIPKKWAIWAREGLGAGVARTQALRCCVGLCGLLGEFGGEAESECFDLVGQALGVSFRAAQHH